MLAGESLSPAFYPMMKIRLIVLISALFTPFSAIAKDDVPRGFTPLVEIKEAQTEAASGKKLVVLVVKGMDDACPNSAAALENGLKAVGSGVVKVFARAETIGKADASNFTPALRERVKKNFIGGAYVTFVVFDPAMTQIVAESSRKELQDDKAATTAFKKTVQEAKKGLK
ncbi:MAG: hypothetical protein RLZZ214_2537 [Verrucomicrobiota bacterium]